MTFSLDHLFHGSHSLDDSIVYLPVAAPRTMQIPAATSLLFAAAPVTAWVMGENYVEELCL